MLSVARLRNTKDERHGEKIESSSFYIGGGSDINEFAEFSTDGLLDSIDFDDIFIGMESEVDVLPDLEMDADILGDFSVSGGEEESESVNYNTESGSSENIHVKNCELKTSTDEEIKISDSGSGTSSLHQGEEILSKRDNKSNSSGKGAADKGKKSSKNQQGKRKVKVDWTPELHRRFVQVVEQLGVDKAVPSRILELMGIDCLTRHNIASHLQKYRSHRKHLLAREAEAASWSQRRQIYNGGVALAGCKREMISNPNWFTPTIGFPPAVTPMAHFRPLHVWGHPSMDQRHIWPKHNFSSNSRTPVLWSAPAPAQPSHLQQVPNSMPHGTPCFQPPPPTPTNFRAPPSIPGLPPHAMFKVDDIAGVPSTPQACPHPPIDFHPSKESIDAALEDVLTKPWLPLPLGLKPPSTDSVVVELHRQGIKKIPPPTSCG